MVRKVVAYELLSLDGVAERPDEFVTDFDDGGEGGKSRDNWANGEKGAPPSPCALCHP